jgi:hypothetical protein
MCSAMTTFLAASDPWVALVILFIGLVVWVWNKLSKAGSAPGPGRPGGPVSTRPLSGTPPTDIDELARRRREQLEMLARQRAGGMAADQPTNITMEQLRQRAQAKLEYERRVAALRAGASPAAGAPPVARSAPPAAPPRPQSGRGSVYRPAPAAPPPRPQRQVQRPAVRPPAAAPRTRPGATPALPAPPAEFLPKIEVLEDVHRMVSDAEPGAVAVPLAAAVASVPQPNPALMRKMMIWREILSPPLALRSDPE